MKNFPANIGIDQQKGFIRLPLNQIIPSYYNYTLFFKLLLIDKSFGLDCFICFDSCYNQRMENKKKQVTIEPEHLHRNQSVTQVLLPIIGAGLICLTVCLLLLFSTSAEPQSTEQWAQISTMFLIFPTLFLGLVSLALLIGLAILSSKWNKSWPPALRNVRLVIINFEKNIQGLAQKPAQPVIKLKSILAGIKAVFKK
ncbi:MAG: hypothetical protein CVU42_09235 [Chloroflexi bacterium HGW-Chloroflexi-4]|nr:MAG: hypothetical protein CVU42_09235 [Chloroflexi bacterium HGW-Chloroflexi-4]